MRRLLPLALTLTLTACGDEGPIDLMRRADTPDSGSPSTPPPPPNNDPPPPPNDDPAPLEQAGGSVGPVDSAPFDIDAYQSVVWPVLERSCLGGVACHGGYETSRGGGLRLYDAPAGAQQHYDNFLRVRAYTNLADPPYSKLLLEGLGVSVHAGGGIWAEADAGYLAVLGWIEEAAGVEEEEQPEPIPDPEEPPPEAPPPPGCTLPDVQNSRYDFDVYVTAIQPGFNQDCATAACHGGGDGGGLELTITDDPTSCEMVRNFFVSQRFAFPNNVEASPLLLKPLYDAHTGGSIYAGEADPRYQALEAWILAVGAEQADEVVEIADDGESPFDYPRFQERVAPLLVDPGAPSNCADRSCHGSNEEVNRGGLFLFPNPELGSNEMASDFHAIAAFADAENPAASPLLTKAAGAGGHRVVLTPDQNAYEEILDWIYRARGFARLDPVYYAERVQPIFDDPAACGEDNLRFTCASVGACHGTYQPARGPENRSQFGLIPAPDSIAALRHNYDQASNMVSLRAPERSPLILQPLAADQGGVYHSGGDNWQADDEWTQGIRRWIEGMHPTAEGYIRDWLVLGAVDPGGEGLARDWLGETEPVYGGTVAGQTWGARVGGDDYVALEGDGLHHAAAFLINDTGGALTVDLFFGAASYGEVWLRGERVLADRDAAAPDVGALATAPAITLAPGINRVLVKVLGGADGSGFYLRVRDRAEGDLGGLTVRLGGVEGGAAFGGGGGDNGGNNNGGDDRPQDVLDRGVFENQVLPVLAGAGGGCGNGAGCHQERAGGFYFSQNYAGNAEEIQRIWDRLSARAVNVADPDASTILTKPLSGNGVNHAGGKAWNDANAAGYQTIANWIRAASQ